MSARARQRVVEVELNSPDVAEGVAASVRDIVRDLLDSLDPKSPSRPAPPPPPPPPPAPPRQEVSMILDMLANGVITAEEAAALIDAVRK